MKGVQGIVLAVFLTCDADSNKHHYQVGKIPSSFFHCKEKTPPSHGCAGHRWEPAVFLAGGVWTQVPASGSVCVLEHLSSFPLLT